MNGLSRVVRAGRKFWVKEYGPIVTEYAVLLAFIILGAFAMLLLIGAFVRNSFSTVHNWLPES